MNRLNRIFHNKQIKLFWFLRSFARYLTPKRLLQSRLDRVLAEAERLSLIHISEPTRPY